MFQHSWPVLASSMMWLFVAMAAQNKEPRTCDLSDTCRNEIEAKYFTYMERVFVSSSSYRLMLLIGIAENPETGEILLGGPNLSVPESKKAYNFKNTLHIYGPKTYIINILHHATKFYF